MHSEPRTGQAETPGQKPIRSAGHQKTNIASPKQVQCAAASYDDDILFDVKTAAQFLHETVSGLESQARTGVGPRFISMDPLRYHPDDLLKYAKERAAGASQRKLKSSTAAPVEGNIKSDPVAVPQAKSIDYKSLISSFERHTPNNASHAVTISFKPQDSRFAGLSVTGFNEMVGSVLRPTTQKIIGRLMRRLAKIHEFDGYRGRTEYPFWILGERISKHAVSEVRLHWHGRLFLAGRQLECFEQRKKEIKALLKAEFERRLCTASIKIEKDNSGFAEYPLKHISKDVMNLEWFITNLK